MRDEMSYGILEVGSGSHSGHSKLHTVKSVIYADVRVTDFNRKLLHVCCDGQHLPFRNGSFKIVFSRGVIEYVDNPMLFLKEMLRVAKKYASVITPHRFGRVTIPKGVKYKFGAKWFRQLGQTEKFNVDMRIEYGLFRLTQDIAIPFVMAPRFLIVRLWKNEKYTK